MANTIGNKIKQLRDERRISQDQMAAHLGVTQSNYGRLEKDDKRLNLHKLPQIAQFLGVSMAELISGDGQPACANKDEVYELLLGQLRGEVKHLKEEVTFLREQFNK